MTVKKNEKHNAVVVIEKVIKWLFYVELVIVTLTFLSYLSDGAWGVGSILVPPFSIIIAILSIFIVTRIKYTSNLVRIAIALNWVVILMLIYNVTD